MEKWIQGEEKGPQREKDKTLGFRPHKDSVKRLKLKLKTVTNRSNGKSSTWVKLKLRQIGQGWIQYFKLADMKRLLNEMDCWLRRRIRMRVWKTWKRVRTRYKHLQKLGINKYKAWEWANTRKGYWRVEIGRASCRERVSSLV